MGSACCQQTYDNKNQITIPSPSLPSEHQVTYVIPDSVQIHIMKHQANLKQINILQIHPQAFKKENPIYTLQCQNPTQVTDNPQLFANITLTPKLKIQISKHPKENQPTSEFIFHTMSNTISNFKTIKYLIIDFSQPLIDPYNILQPHWVNMFTTLETFPIEVFHLKFKASFATSSIFIPSFQELAQQIIKIKHLNHLKLCFKQNDVGTGQEVIFATVQILEEKQFKYFNLNLSKSMKLQKEGDLLTKEFQQLAECLQKQRLLEVIKLNFSQWSSNKSISKSIINGMLNSNSEMIAWDQMKRIQIKFGNWNYENGSFLENLKEQLTIKTKHESKLKNLSLILKEFNPNQEISQNPVVDVINTLSQHKMLETLRLHLSCKWQNKHIGDRTLQSLTNSLSKTPLIQHIDLNLQNWGFINGTQNLTHVGVLNFWLELSNLQFLKSIKVKLNLRMHPDEWREQIMVLCNQLINLPLLCRGQFNFDLSMSNMKGYFHAQIYAHILSNFLFYRRMGKSIIHYLNKLQFDGKMRLEMFDLILERLLMSRINWQNAGVDYRVLTIC